MALRPLLDRSDLRAPREGGLTSIDEPLRWAAQALGDVRDRGGSAAR